MRGLDSWTIQSDPVLVTEAVADSGFPLFKALPERMQKHKSVLGALIGTTIPEDCPATPEQILTKEQGSILRM